MYAVRDNKITEANRDRPRTHHVRSDRNSVGFFGDYQVKRIPLTQGKVALVDDEDFDALNKHKWQAQKWAGGFYATRSQYLGGKPKNPRYERFKMHRVILNAPGGMEVDHRDHNGLNNTRENIRLCTHSQNQQNGNPYKNSSSKYKGVSTAMSKKNPWRAYIYLNHQSIYLGNFKTEVEAAEAYDKKAKELFGEFAHTNF